jgi:hypothetical protein
MKIFELLKQNKGTVSSALGKELAQKVLDGDKDILLEAIELSVYNPNNKGDKRIRAGAAKIVEIVAEKQPEWVAPYLEKLLPGLSVAEPQTRWMTIRTMGFCAKLNEQVASQALLFAEKYVATKNEGLIVPSSADLFLGDYGAISENHAAKVFPILEKSMSNVIKNEHDWLLEACYKIFKNVGANEQEIILSFARLNLESERKSTQKRANKILKLSEK